MNVEFDFCYITAIKNPLAIVIHSIDGSIFPSALYYLGILKSKVNLEATYQPIVFKNWGINRKNNVELSWLQERLIKNRSVQIGVLQQDRFYSNRMVTCFDSPFLEIGQGPGGQNPNTRGAVQ